MSVTFTAGSRFTDLESVSHLNVNNYNAYRLLQTLGLYSDDDSLYGSVSTIEMTHRLESARDVIYRYFDQLETLIDEAEASGERLITWG